MLLIRMNSRMPSQLPLVHSAMPMAEAIRRKVPKKNESLMAATGPMSPTLMLVMILVSKSGFWLASSSRAEHTPLTSVFMGAPLL